MIYLHFSLLYVFPPKIKYAQSSLPPSNRSFFESVLLSIYANLIVSVVDHEILAVKYCYPVAAHFLFQFFQYLIVISDMLLIIAM